MLKTLRLFSTPASVLAPVILAGLAAQIGAVAQTVVPQIVLPATVQFTTTSINATLDASAATGGGYFTLNLTGIGTGYSITNGPYKAWCADYANSSFELNPANTTGSPVYLTSPSSGIPASFIPFGDAASVYNEVNYILNNKTGNGTGTTTVLDVQEAIWVVLGGATNLPSSVTSISANAQAMVTAAQSHSTFSPSNGQIEAVLYAITIPGPRSTQNLFFEVPTPVNTQQMPPSISMTKTAGTSKCNPFDQVTYTYTVTNTGGVTVNNIVVTDDNGTPTIPGDDFTVGTIASLAPGKSATLTATVYLPVTYASNSSGNSWGNSWGNNFNYNNQQPGGTLSCRKLSNGNVQFLYTEDSSLVDNTYGKNSSSDWGWGGNSFQNLQNAGAEFQVLDQNGNVYLDFVADYISQNSSYPSGYGTDGIKGGGGLVYCGNKSNVVSVDTSLSHCLNSSPSFYQCTKDSPPAGTSGWQVPVSYTVTVNCGSSGFGGIKIPVCQNNPSKQSQCNNTYQKPVSSTVTNTATATGTPTGVTTTVTATAKATVTVDASQQGWSQCGKY